MSPQAFFDGICPFGFRVSIQNLARNH